MARILEGNGLESEDIPTQDSRREDPCAEL